MSMQGKVSLITGGATGIGLAVAKRFIEDGAVVFLAARRAEMLQEAVDDLGPNAIAIQADVTKVEDLTRLYAAISEQQGKLDLLVVNAGRADFSKLKDITPSHYDSIFDLNVGAALFTVQYALPLMQFGGTITLIGSVADTIGTEGYTAYNASKAAIRSFARTWTRELAPKGIRVNVVSPGPTQTAMTEEASEEVKRALCALIPLGRIGRVEEVAAAVRFLASDESSFIAGAELCVDGGMTQV